MGIYKKNFLRAFAIDVSLFILNSRSEKSIPYGGLMLGNKYMRHCVLAISAFCMHQMYADIVQLNKARYEKVVAKYAQLMADEYNEILQGFFALCGGVSANEWNAHMAFCLPRYEAQENSEIAQLQQKQSRPLRQETVALCRTILQQAGISRSVQIISDSETPSDLYAFRSSLMINELQCDMLYPQEKHKEAVLWHEMQHLKFEDTFIGFCINELYKKYEKYASHLYDELAWNSLTLAWNALIHRWGHFIERRADILGALANPSLIQARRQSLQYIMHNFDNSCDSDHPSIASRCAMIAQLEREIQG